MTNLLRQYQKTAYKAARDAGLSDQAAKVMTANFSGESLGNPGQRGWDIKHFSQGIAQWDENRAKRIKVHFGKFPKDMTVTEQVNAFIWECKRFYPKTWHALTNSTLSPKEQMEVIVRDFERPKNPERDINRRMVMYAALSVIEDDDGTKTA